MNAVEIEAAVSELALQAFESTEFPFAFLAAFGNKETALKRLRLGNNNTSDVPGGVLQRSNIHLAVCEPGKVGETLTALRLSPATGKAKAKFILATDGEALEAEDLLGVESIACDSPDFPNHFGFFLPIAGISTIKEIKDNPIVGLSSQPKTLRHLYSVTDNSKSDALDIKHVENINAYLTPSANIIVKMESQPLSDRAEMSFGKKPVDGGHLLLSKDELDALCLTVAQHDRFIRRIYGSAEFIRGLDRYCLWIDDCNLDEALSVTKIRERIKSVREMRLASRDSGANEMAAKAHQMREMNIAQKWTITIPRTSSEHRPFLPSGQIDNRSTVTSEAFAPYDAPLWNMALIASRLHLVWIGTVCGKMKTDFRYSNTLSWNTFPVPLLIEQNKADLTTCAENILLAREAHFPATIADLSEPESMPENLRHAHVRNDEVLERIYIGRRFKNDTERLEKFFELYIKRTLTAAKAAPAKKTAKRKYA